MSNYSFQFEKNVHLSDKKIDSAESHLFVYLLSTSDILKEILVFREDANQKLLKLIIHVTIQDIQPRGLIKFESSEGTFDDIKSENAFINQVYINIRNLYHEHTHHDGDDSTAADSLLLLSLNNDNNSKALNEIFRNRQRKIITYHKLIKDALKETRTKVAVEATHSLIRQAKGEFIYSIIFLDLYFFRSKDYQLHVKLFENAIRSIDTFYEEANTKYLFELTEVQTKVSNEILKLTDVQTKVSNEILKLTEIQTKLSKRIFIFTVILVAATVVLIFVTIWCSLFHS